jgi:transcriptional regulator with XRE-family HTH domain
VRDEIEYGYRFLQQSYTATDKPQEGAMSRSNIAQQLKARNAEIGLLLRRAREAAGRTQAECGEQIAASRQKYNRLENGHEEIGVAAYERLLTYLNAWPRWISPQDPDSTAPQYVAVEALPGQTVHISVRVPESAHSPEASDSSGGAC